MNDVLNGHLERAIRGDQDALAACLEEIGPQVRTEIAPQIPARWRSVLSEDDVMQQSYADAFRGISSFVPLGDGAFRAWLSSIARCNLKDAVRMLETEKRGGKRKRANLVLDNDTYLNLLDVLSHTGTTPTKHAHRGEVVVAIRGALDTLPKAYRQVVQMYDLEGRTAEEISQSMGRSIGAIYMLRSRAHDRLRQAVGCEDDFFSDSP